MANSLVKGEWVVNYYALHVKTGSEISVAKRLEKLNCNMDGRLFKKIVVPFSTKTTIDTQTRQAYQQNGLLFNSYIFLQLDDLTSEIYSKLKEVSTSVFKIIQEPILESEMEFLTTGQVTEFVFEPADETVLDKIQQLMFQIIESKKSKVQVIVKDKRYLSILTNTKIAKDILERNNFRIADLIGQPLKLLNSILRLYERQTTSS